MIQAFRPGWRLTADLLEKSSALISCFDHEISKSTYDLHERKSAFPNLDRFLQFDKSCQDLRVSRNSKRLQSREGKIQSRSAAILEIETENLPLGKMVEEQSEVRWLATSNDCLRKK
jgi:hypothetical protein